MGGRPGKRCLAGRAGKRKVTIHETLFQREEKTPKRRLPISRKERRGFVSASSGSFRAEHGLRQGPGNVCSLCLQTFGGILGRDVEHGQNPPLSIPGIPVERRALCQSD